MFGRSNEGHLMVKGHDIISLGWNSFAEYLTEHVINYKALAENWHVTVEQRPQ